MTTDFLTSIRTLATEYDMLPRGELVLCAVSGGADSVSLLHALLQLQEELGFSLQVAHFNHHLRGTDADMDASFVEALCHTLHIPCSLGSGDVSAAAKKMGRGLEDSARLLRYDFLRRTAEKIGATRIATAHTADDNLETLLLHLVRGAGLRGLCGIPPRRDLIVRPLLELDRSDVLHYLSSNQLTFREDASNADTRFARNRLRADVVPILRELNPRLSQNITATTRTLRADQAYLSARAFERSQRVKQVSDGFLLDTRLLSEVPPAIASRVALQVLDRLHVPNVSTSHLEQIIALARSEKTSGSISLPGKLIAQKNYQDILFTKTAELPPIPLTPLVRDGVTWLDAPFSVFCNCDVCPDTIPKNVLYLRADLSPFLRSRLPGDQIQLPGRGHKSLKKLFIDSRIPRRFRNALPILADQDGVLAVPGIGADIRAIAKTGDIALRISFQTEK